MTHTYALLEVSPATYFEIKGKLLEAGYAHALNSEGEIDMHGIGLHKSEASEAGDRSALLAWINDLTDKQLLTLRFKVDGDWSERMRSELRRIAEGRSVG